MKTEPALQFQRDEAFARHLDETDPLREYRDQFLIPKQSNGGGSQRSKHLHRVLRAGLRVLQR
jgi:hypothetical protein